MIIKLDELNKRKYKEGLKYIRGIVYKITNNINNKSYIAVTTNSIIDIVNSKIGNKELLKDIKEYGSGNFSVEILEYDKTAEQLNELKKQYISTFKTNKEEFGYNKRVLDITLERELVVTKEVAQSKLDTLGRQFNIENWKGTSKPVRVSCKFCGVSDIYSAGKNILAEDNTYFQFRECKFCGNLYHEVEQPISLLGVKRFLDLKTNGNFDFNILTWDIQNDITILNCKKCNFNFEIGKGIVAFNPNEIYCMNCIKLEHEKEREAKQKLYDKKNKYREIQKELLNNKKHYANILIKIKELDEKSEKAKNSISRNNEVIEYIKNDYINALYETHKLVKEAIENNELVARTNFNEKLMEIIDPKRILINSNKMVDELILDSIYEYKVETINRKMFYIFEKEKESYISEKISEILKENQKWIEINENNLKRYEGSYNVYNEKLKKLVEVKEDNLEKLKYEFTGEEKTMEFESIVYVKDHWEIQNKEVVLKQIKRISDDKVGGWIESENNLSQNGNCFVMQDAIVMGNAKVFDNAIVAQGAMVYGNAEIKENAILGVYATVYGNAIIKGNARIYGKSEVYDNALIIDNTKVTDNAKIYGDAVICENAQIYGDSQIKDRAIICENVIIEGDDIIGEYTIVGDELKI